MQADFCHNIPLNKAVRYGLQALESDLKSSYFCSGLSFTAEVSFLYLCCTACMVLTKCLGEGALVALSLPLTSLLFRCLLLCLSCAKHHVFQMYMHSQLSEAGAGLV